MYHNIRKIHLDPTSNCNASCPQCSRNFRSSPLMNPLLSLNEWSADEIGLVLEDPALANIYKILINGNFGDIVMHSHPKEFIQVIHESRDERPPFIQINTNGGGLHKSFWSWLGTVDNFKVDFALDGLEDTHHLYRRNTRFDTVVRNAREYIDAGGKAAWVMTVFEHNEHQIEQCKELSQRYGFDSFVVRNSIRFAMGQGHAVYDKNFELDYFLNPSSAAKKTINDNELMPSEVHTPEQLKRLYEGLKKKRKKDGSFYEKSNCEVSCYAKQTQDIFLSYDKQLLPCCYMGIMESKAPVHLRLAAEYYKQKNLPIDYNNPLKNSIASIIESGFLQHIEQSWKQENKVVVCSRYCSVDKGRFNLKELNTGKTINV